MKVIFLDIDGVLNTEKRLLNNNGELYVEKDKIELLKEIIDKTKAKVVLSSTWRVLAQSKDSKEYPKYEAFEIELEKHGIAIFGYTPVFLDYRPLEIKMWLESQSDQEICFVSLDDDFEKKDYDKYGIGDCLIKTDFSTGMTEAHAKRAVELLNREK